MRSLHYRYCIVGVALAAVLLIALGAAASTIGYVAVLLACPLMMFVMMRMMMGSQPSARERDERPSTTTNGDPSSAPSVGPPSDQDARFTGTDPHHRRPPSSASYPLGPDPKEANVRGYTLDKDDYLLRLRKKRSDGQCAEPAGRIGDPRRQGRGPAWWPPRASR